MIDTSEGSSSPYPQEGIPTQEGVPKDIDTPRVVEKPLEKEGTPKEAVKVPKGEKHGKNDDDEKSKEREITFVLHPVPSLPHEGVWLKKGALPSNPPLTETERNFIRHFRHDFKSGQEVQRDAPLTAEELACWDEQNLWLMCPISKKSWKDSNAYIGLGLYHAPRFLSKSEKQRAVSDEAEATRVRKEKVAAQDVHREQTNDDWGQFQVYPRVNPPPGELIPEADRNLAKDMRPGRISVIVGPAFDINAYNWGVLGHKMGQQDIKEMKERGILSMDQQYDAFNFVFYVERADNSYQMCPCTSRLSFYIEGKHGARVFPHNIESQLSLLLWRTPRFMRRHDGSTDPALLSHAIKWVMPKVLEAVVMETVKGRESALPTRTDQALRIYLLVHQTAIKLIIYYPEVYSRLYNTVMQWIQSPFCLSSLTSFDDLIHVLITASLVGVPWSMLRYAFVLRLFAQMIAATPAGSGMAIRARLAHYFRGSHAFLLRLMQVFSFFVGGRSLVELDQVYERCMGSLPPREMKEMKERMARVDDVDGLEKLWVALGMDKPDAEERHIHDHISRFIKHIMENRDRWHYENPLFHAIVPPPLSTTTSKALPSSSSAAPSVVDFKVSRQDVKHEQGKHEGYPPLQPDGKLDSLVCNYPQCGKAFKSRMALFHHLKRAVGRERMVPAYHKRHWEYTAPTPVVGTVCGACNHGFADAASLQEHYAKMGVPNILRAERARQEAEKVEKSREEWERKKEEERKKRLPSVDLYENPDVCVVCSKKSREVMFVPCGHCLTCEKCASCFPHCPVCGTEVLSVMRTFV